MKRMATKKINIFQYSYNIFLLMISYQMPNQDQFGGRIILFYFKG